MLRAFRVLSIGKLGRGSEDYYLSVVASGVEDYYLGSGEAPGGSVPIIKNRGHFPNDDAVVKLLWLAIRDIEDKRARART